MEIRSAIVITVLPHGENGAIVKVLAPEGVVAGFVPGGRSRALRPVLQPGNGVALRGRARGGTLPLVTVEATQTRTALALDRGTAAAVAYLTGLVAAVVDEGTAHPRLHAALDGLLDAMSNGANPLVWHTNIVRFELLLLAELGFGLDLSSCVATGRAAADADLAYVSPRSSHAVGREAGAPYADKLLPLPTFLLASGAATSTDVDCGYRTTGHFLERDILVGSAAGVLAVRARLIALLT